MFNGYGNALGGFNWGGSPELGQFPQRMPQMPQRYNALLGMMPFMNTNIWQPPAPPPPQNRGGGGGGGNRNGLRDPRDMGGGWDRTVSPTGQSVLWSNGDQQFMRNRGSGSWWSVDGATNDPSNYTALQGRPDVLPAWQPRQQGGAPQPRARGNPMPAQRNRLAAFRGA